MVRYVSPLNNWTFTGENTFTNSTVYDLDFGCNGNRLEVVGKICNSKKVRTGN